MKRKFTEEHKKKLSLAHEGMRPVYSFPKGNIPWNKGVQMSLEHRKKLSEIRLKDPVRYWLGKNRPTGEHSANWRGGKTPRNKRYLDIPGYRNWRSAIFQRDGYRCLFCGLLGFVEADHIYRWVDYPTLRFDINNGQTLCRECHRIKSKFEMRKNTNIIFATQYSDSVLRCYK